MRRAAVALAGLLLIALPARAAADPPTLQQVVDAAVAHAAGDGIVQSVAIVDRSTGQSLATHGGDRQYISESIVKLFTVAYYETEKNPDSELAATLRTMIIRSDDHIESELWNTDIVPSMAARYHLPNTSNGAKTGPHDWGWENITANDEVKFLYEMSKDDQVAPLLMDAMANVAAYGADGFDQHFGMNALTGDHGSKQGWTDVGSEPRVQIHSVGWTDKYFVAILQTSTSSDYDTMRADATSTAQAILDAEKTEHPAVASSTPATTSSAPPPTTVPVESAGSLATGAATIRATITASVTRICSLMGI